MFAVVGFLLLALGPPAVHFDGETLVPHSSARKISVTIERPTYIEAKYQARKQGAQVRAALVTAEGVHDYQENGSYEALAVTPYAESGELRFLVMRPGKYVVLIDNRLDTRTSILVHAVVTSVEDPSLPRTLPASRRHAVTAISLTLFAVVAGWSGWRLRRTRLFG